MAKLTVMQDNRPVRIFRVVETLSMGRDPNNEVQVIDAKVSRRHCIVERRKGFFIVKDLGSRNGTYLNGVQITESKVSSGDRIRIGDSEMLFEEEPIFDAASTDESKSNSSEISSHFKILDHTFELKHLAQFDEKTFGTQKLRQAIEKLTTLFEVGNIISKARDSGNLMNSILEQITRVIKADRCYLLLADRKTGDLIPAAIRTVDGDEPTPQLSKTIINQVMQSSVSILSPDAFQDERFHGSESIFIHSIRSAMCVPLRSHDRILGIIHVDTKGSFDTFSEEDLKLLTAIGISAGIAIENMQLFEDLKKLFRSTVRSLVATIEANDVYTGGHSVRVAEFAKQMAICMGLPEDEIELVELAAFLHDVGKVGIPNSVLNKPGKFDPEELQMVRDHPKTGAGILSNIEGMEYVSKIVKHHHEAFDGSGYPDQLKGEDIPLASRILCVADTLDAITTDRAYRLRKTMNDAINEMSRCAGSQFDPEIIKVIKKCVAIGVVDIS